MKSFIVVIIFIVSTSYMVGQEKQNIRIDQENAQLVILLSKHLFYATNVDSGKKPSDIIFCNDYETIYFLDSLKISEEIYLKEDLLYNVTDSEGFYSLVETKNDTLTCVNVLKLFLNIKIPISLNNVQLETENKKQILANIKPEKFIIYKENKSLFSSYFS